MPNRLVHEDSPYLRQHAENPVDWWPWCDEAFALALETNRPIFLSIGYSSCHWCHVMEREVFEDEKIAAYLNAHFVSIKVDREERPDIDKHYQSVHQLLNQRPGGWPLSIFMTPDKKPFFAGTYIPPVRKYNMMGFLELIEVIDKKWRQAPEDIVKNADEIARFLEPKEGPVKATRLEPLVADSFIRQARESYDATYGGFSKAPKFPHTSTLELLLDLGLFKQFDEADEMALHTLRMMARGGLYDPVDGGFCRYSTDDFWLVPHFEKMTYDNALLIRAYIQAYRRSGEALFWQIARETIAFMEEKMQESRLFYAASDADTEGVEGKYFVYDYDEVVEALKKGGFDADEAREICQELSITKEGNFEGKSIVRFQGDARPAWWPKVRKILRDLRSSRPYPFIDKKILTSWNAMMVGALFAAADIDESYLERASASLEALLALMRKENRLYHSALAGKSPTIEGFLEDYAYLTDALLRAYETTQKERWLVEARLLADEAIARFHHRGRWYFSRGEFTTEADIADTSYPASAAVMTEALLSLASLLGEARYREIAFKTLEYHSYKIMRYPLYHPAFTTAVLRFVHEDVVVKATPEKLKEAKEVLKKAPYPWLLLKSEATPGYLVCNQHSCFAQAENPEALAKALAKI
ncbi:thioredoxin domain-containing protein [Hydrogenimonas sp.]